ncbi:peroxiredoxin family protein [Hirschia baltica]|uniref:Alkyl hydroperoxide reductase/ Thiol specific antioxidant/ Mal allergen n=1 Tax=Hirschia baltica (strain ATCC 49814 / DSM 5838 / IFAM 1418) TaxID=582402 RepID=C6XML7_HIRBI|nr:peroxiredoxin family protein [Hirschia baltica]ACT59931.1 alkyl hydroperoxide reductase/ Thiol specific antioxidant/ Mal allergen [Hirschia baltica ATCC 49814]
MKSVLGAVLTASLLLSAPLALAEDHKKKDHVQEIGLAVGKAVPTVEDEAIGVVSSAGDVTSLPALMGEKGVTVAFVRSADWCPYCKKQMIDLDKIAPQLEKLGFPLVALSYDAPETLAKFKEKHELSYTFVSDTDSANIKAFGLLNEKYEVGSRAYGIPHPAVMVISSDNVIVEKLMEEGYKKRPASEAVLEAVQSVQQETVE